MHLLHYVYTLRLCMFLNKPKTHVCWTSRLIRNSTVRTLTTKAHVRRVIRAVGASPRMGVADVCAGHEEDHADCRTVARVPNIGTRVDAGGDASRTHVVMWYKMNGGGGLAYYPLQNIQPRW